MEHMRCNRCGTPMQSKSQCIAATCSHLFCTKCAQDILDADEPCPMCEGLITRSNVKQVTIMQASSNLQLSMCGQTPHTIMEAALSGIKFYCEQQRLSAQYEQNVFNKKFTKMQAQCKQKLEQVHQGYVQAKRKYQDTAQERNALQQDVQELQAKYSQKSVQARKLQEMFKALQQEHEDLKRRYLGNGRGGTAATGHMAQLSGSGSGRGGHPSPFGGGPAQMVTTVHQRRSVIELSPTPGAGGFLGQGSTTVPPQRPGTAAAFGHNMFAATTSPGLQPPTQHRPTTGSGGMFGGGGLGGGGNRIGMGGAGGGGGMRLGQRNMGLTSPQGLLSM